MTRSEDREEEVGPPLLPADERKRSEQPQEAVIDVLHESLSRGFLSTATWIDSFFGNEQFDAEANQSRLKIRYVGFREGSGKMQFRPNLDIKWALPQLKKKTYLVITGDPREDIGTPTSTVVPQGNPLLVPENRHVTTALQYFFRSTDRRSYSVMSGAKFHKGKPMLFLGPRARYLRPLDAWNLRFVQEVLWYSDSGWSMRTRFDLERPVRDKFFFRTSLEGIWKQDKSGYPYLLSFGLLQPLDRNRAISYEWGNSFQTRPTNELDEVIVTMRYRQRIWREWLYLEIAPQDRFPRDHSFREVPGITFKLEMIIGEYRTFMF